MRPSRLVSLWSRNVATAGVATLVAGLIVGCQPPPKPAPAPMPPPPVPTAQQVETARQQFATVDPHARVGHVSTVDTSMHMAAVAGIPLADVKVGDTISFTGPDHSVFANGTITDLDSRTTPTPFVIVDYSKASVGGRDPAYGDLAITVTLGR